MESGMSGSVEDDPAAPQAQLALGDRHLELAVVVSVGACEKLSAFTLGVPIQVSSFPLGMSQ